MLAGVLHRKRIDMTIQDHVQFDAHTYIRFSIFWEANWRPDRPIMSAQDYLEKYKQNIFDTCKVFELLSLAVPNDKSPLNWSPASYLVNLVAPPQEPPEGGKDLATDTDQEAAVIESVFPTLDELPETSASYVQEVLAFVGLLKRAVSGQRSPYYAVNPDRRC
jgi:hypothetical protein